MFVLLFTRTHQAGKDDLSGSDREAATLGGLDPAVVPSSTLGTLLASDPKGYFRVVILVICSGWAPENKVNDLEFGRRLWHILLNAPTFSRWLIGGIRHRDQTGSAAQVLVPAFENWNERLSRCFPAVERLEALLEVR